ncbi:CLUMA_CG004370, isoform A [Clunio marinus]|uniref:RING-type E3 ubiquitin transferase n=1 Tax=Clunio marinus TaxID=568069 RepID=A0A1J1HRL8_9DIPT|nr:CLUMA_CG004370, isoform A [Clunio marinus]
MASLSTAIFQPSTSQHLVEKLNIPCRYYNVGLCRFGDNCRYLHVEESSSIPTPFENNNCDLSLASTSSSSSSTSTNFLNPQAPIFVPISMRESDSQPKTYADVVNANRPIDPIEWTPPVDDSLTLCPFLMKSGFCRYENCCYAHGEMCELCGKFCLDPLNSEQRKQHHSECIAAHEKEMELAFSIQRSKEKTCGICFDIVWEKDSREQRFGILPNCNHCFCLECIRTWRQAKQFDNKIIRSCPECRTCSDFVCPSSFWVDNPEEKQQLISKYKTALKEKDCKYFKKGAGTCPFGNKCFYRHCLPDGKTVDVGEPTRPIRLNSLGQLDTRLQSVLFWDFLEERIVTEDLFASDSDSDSSDFIFY